jgi:hypothetical protein
MATGMASKNSRKERRMVGNHSSPILDGQAKPIFSFCGNTGHVENTCRAKERATKEATQSTKEKAQKWKKDKLEKAQSFTTATTKKRLPVPPRIMILMMTSLMSKIS